MTTDELKVVFEEQAQRCREVLLQKGMEYTPDEADRFSSFKTAASLQHTSPAGRSNTPPKYGARKSPTRSTIFSSYQRSSRRKNAIKRIEVKVLNTGAVREAEKHTVFAARLTQRGHEIHSMDDLLMLYEKAYTENTLERITTLPHPTVQKFAVITVAVVGASRRFLSQITRHQNEVKFMSASLQYSNYDGKADFVIPYEILTASQDVQEMYMKSCQSDMDSYAALIQSTLRRRACAIS